MLQKEIIHLEQRATAEFQAALRAGSPSAAKPHYEMAVRCLEKAENMVRLLRSGEENRSRRLLQLAKSLSS